MSGKGSAPRPFSVSNEEYANRWDAIFSKKEPEPVQQDLFCKHEVWGYDYREDMYFCNECGLKAKSPSMA